MLLFPSQLSRTEALAAAVRRGLVLSGLLLVIGCGDYECKEDESSCDGNVARTCDYDGEAEVSRWRELDCGRLTCTKVDSEARCATSEDPDPHCEATDTAEPPPFCFQGSIVSCVPSGHATLTTSCELGCVEGSESAVCSQSSGPDPRCGDADFVCDGSLLIRCEQGYRTSENTCSAADDGAYCITSGKTAFCAASPEPDPICTADTVCDGTSKLSCREGYRQKSRSCDMGICATTSQGPLCVLGAEPEPACADVVTGTICDGNAELECVDGYAVSRNPCDDGTCHAFSAAFAACVIADMPDPNCQATRAVESYCDGELTVYCAYGYPTARTSCNPGEHCTPPAADSWNAQCSAD